MNNSYIPYPPRPSQQAICRGATLWGTKPPEPAALPPIVASNYRAINRNTLIGTADLTVTKWRYKFKACLWHRKGDKEWIAFPAKEWVDQEGNRKFSDLGGFINHGDGRRFREEALAAVHRLVESQGPPS